MDVTNLECDAVVHLRNGEYGLVEIKIGGEGLINEGAASLKKLKVAIFCKVSYHFMRRTLHLWFKKNPVTTIGRPFSINFNTFHLG